MPELTFPALDDAALDPWEWPAPPFAKWALHAVDDTPPPACLLDTPSGAVMHGELVASDIRSGQVRFRSRDGGPELALPLSRFTRLTLPAPCRLLDSQTREPYARLPVAAQEREYRLERDAGQPAFSGHTMGHVESAQGLYLYPPLHEQGAVQRMFVPKSAYRSSHFGLSVEDAAAQHWIATPAELLQALAAQQHTRVVPMGRALLQLGLATPAQIQHALAQPLGDMPVGERLVATGLITQGELDAAIAHKLGCPVVDLMRFPLDPRASAKLSIHTAMLCRAVPLMLDDTRIVVAVDRPSRIDELRERQALLELEPVGVLASRSHIAQVLARLAQQQNLWATAGTSHGAARLRGR